jgi:hypothetical protein
MARTRTDYLGDVTTAMQRFEQYGPGMADIRIKSSDLYPHRYGVLVSNIYGKWEASEPTLADSIHRAIDRACIDHFGFTESEFEQICHKRGVAPPTESGHE